MADGDSVDMEKAGGVLDDGGEIVGQIAVPSIASVVRIPVPGTRGLAIELSPRGYVPKSGSTSTLFIQTMDGKRCLRLDYGYNKVTKTIDFHWNQKGTFKEFGIADHAVAGPAGGALYKSARYVKWGGRALMVIGLAIDTYEIVTSDRPWRQAAGVAGGWAGAWVGCKAGGAIGSAVGTAVEPGGGTAVGGFVGCMIGGGVGYWAGKKLVIEAWDMAQPEIVKPVKEIPPPPSTHNRAQPQPRPQVQPFTPPPFKPNAPDAGWANQPIC